MTARLLVKVHVISGPHSGEVVHGNLLGCDTVWSCRWATRAIGPEHGGSVFLQSVGASLQAHTASLPRRPPWL
jgi:hypothetical protein